MFNKIRGILPQTTIIVYVRADIGKCVRRIPHESPFETSLVLTFPSRPVRLPCLWLASDADRFHSDTVGEEHLRRKAQYERKVQINDNRRQVREAKLTIYKTPATLDTHFPIEARLRVPLRRRHSENLCRTQLRFLSAKRPGHRREHASMSNFVAPFAEIASASYFAARRDR